MSTAQATDQQLAEQADEHNVGVQVDQDEELVIEELLVEEVSIDGMCGVY